jgi:histidyl-tRNA synthetase
MQAITRDEALALLRSERRQELRERGLDETQIEARDPVFELRGSAREKLEQLSRLFEGNEVGTKGVEERKELFGYVELVQPQCDVELDLTLARGLNYYTGAIFEVKAYDVTIGSICGGGRYDNLTGSFGMPDVSGVGISFGADRIYDVLTELDKFPANLGQSAQVIFINFGAESLPYCIKSAAQLRAAGISTLVYPDAAKMKKQMEFANKSHIPYVVFVGESEIASNTLTVKNMATGEQSTVAMEGLMEMMQA